MADNDDKDAVSAEKGLTAEEFQEWMAAMGFRFDTDASKALDVHPLSIKKWKTGGCDAKIEAACYGLFIRKTYPNMPPPPWKTNNR